MTTRQQQITLECSAGRELEYVFTVTDKNENVVDISGMTPRFRAHTLKGIKLGTSPTINTTAGTASFAVTDGEAGECTLTIPGSSTAALGGKALAWEVIIDDLSADDAEIGWGVLIVNDSMFSGT